jgi:hypothetical protein
MDEYGGYTIVRTLAQDGELRAHGCVLSVVEQASSRELFRVEAWVTGHLGRRTMTGQGVTELAVMFAGEQARALIDAADFEPGTSYREVHGFDPMRARETIVRDRVPLDASPQPPLPAIP